MSPNGDELNEQLEFEERIKNMPSDERTIFIAKQVYALANKVDALTVGGISKKTSAATSAITTSVMVGIIEGLKALFARS